MAYTEAQKRASQKFQAKQSSLSFRIPPEQYAKYKAEAEKRGMSLRSFVLSAIDDSLNMEFETSHSDQAESYLPFAENESSSPIFIINTDGKTFCMNASCALILRKQMPGLKTGPEESESDILMIDLETLANVPNLCLVQRCNNEKRAKMLISSCFELFSARLELTNEISCCKDREKVRRLSAQLYLPKNYEIDFREI